MKKKSIGFSKILMDATIPFQIKPWECEEMKNSDGKVNIGAFRDVKKAVFRWEGLLNYT